MPPADSHKRFSGFDDTADQSDLAAVQHQTCVTYQRMSHFPVAAGGDICTAAEDEAIAAGIQYMLRQLGQRAGVVGVHPHRFRRTIATDLLNRGMPIEQVKEFLGHEKLDTTMIYCAVRAESVKASHRKYA